MPKARLRLWASSQPTNRARIGVVGRFVGICLALLCLSGVASATAGAVSYVDGISDQNLASWESGAANLFANAWVGSPPSHIKLARYVVQWNVESYGEASETFIRFKNWYVRAGMLGLTRDVGLTNYVVGSKEPTSTEYQTELTKLLSQFTGINYVEAWNEPNHKSTKVSFYVTPAAAAHYMNSAYSLCKTHGCTAIAGDFHDDSNIGEYEKEYKASLNPTDPGNWGIHPYWTVLNHNTSRLTEFKKLLTAEASDRVWFTEVGAYYCTAGESPPRGQAAQASDGSWLVNTLMPTTANLEHVFTTNTQPVTITPSTAPRRKIQGSMRLHHPASRISRAA